MTLKQIRYFTVLARQGNFTRAAKELFICQSALSKTIMQLESELGIQLVDRSVRRFKLTAEGEIFSRSGQVALANIDGELARLRDNVNALQGGLVVGIPPVVGTAYFTSVIHRYRSQFPQVHLVIVEAGANTITDKVAAGDVDVGVVILPFHAPGFQVFPVISSDNVLVVGKDHPFAQRESVSFAELRQERFILLDNTFMIHDRIKQLCRDAGFEPHVGFVSSQWDFIADMVSKNQGISILPRRIFTRFRLEDIRLIRLTDPEFPWEIALIIKAGKHLSRPMALFVELAEQMELEQQAAEQGAP